MDRRLRIALTMAGLLSALLLGVGAYVFTTEPSLASAQLSTGERVTLVAVTRGPVERAPFGPRLSQWLPSISLPPALTPGGPTNAPAAPLLAGSPVAPFNRTYSGYAVWLRGPASAGIMAEWDPYTMDSHGCRVRPIYSTWISSWPAGDRSGPGAPELSCGLIHAWPRREAEFNLVVDRVEPWVHEWPDYPYPGPRRATLRCRVAVEGPAIYPSWTPETLPARRKQGYLTVELLGLEPSATDYFKPNGRLARFRYLGTGPNAQNWYARDAVVSDATGNQVAVNANAGNHPTVLDLPGLCAREAAWNLRVSFARRDLKTALPDYRVRLSRKELHRLRHDPNREVELVKRDGSLMVTLGPLYYGNGVPELRIVTNRRRNEWWDLLLRAGRRNPGTRRLEYRAVEETPNRTARLAGALEMPTDQNLESLEVCFYKHQTANFRVKP